MEIEEEFFLEDDLDMIHIMDMGFPRRRWQRAQYFERMDDFTFFKRFRLMKETVLNILELIEDQLEYPHDKNNSVSPINQLLTTLRFYASSGDLAAIADFIGMHESTASRIVSRVSRLLANLYRNFVKFPGPQEALIQTRKTIERTIGVWKRRFPVLAYGLRLKLDTILAVVPATALLYNIAKYMHEPEPPLPHDIIFNELDYLINIEQVPDVPIQANNIYQQQLINDYF